MSEQPSEAAAAAPELPAKLAELATDSERSRFFADHRELLRPDTVERLCEQINHTARVDLQAAEHQLATAGWLADRLADDVARGRHLRASANLLRVKRDLPAAVRAYEAARQLFERAGDQREVVRTLYGGLAALTYLGEFDRAREWGEIALRLCEPLGDLQLTARLEFNIAHSLAYRDRQSEALASFQSAHRHFLEGGSPQDVAAALSNIAVCQQQLNRFEAALEAYREARDYCSENGLPRLVLRLDYNVAYLYFLRGEYTEAIRRFDEVRDRCPAENEHHHAALCDLDQAEIFLELNLLDEAASLARAAGAEFNRLEMRYEAAKALTVEAIAVGRRGAWRESDRLLERARASFAALDNRFWAAATDLFRAGLLQERDPEAAAGLATASLDTFLEIGLPSRIAMCELLLARLALAAGEPSRARELAASARERLGTVGVPAIEYQAHFLAGQAAESAGRPAEGLAGYRRAEATLERLRGRLQSEELKIGLSQDQQGVYEALVALLLGSADGAREPEEPFEVIQRAKSRGLAELLAARVREIRPSRAGKTALVEELNDLRAEVHWLHRQIDLEESQGGERSSEKIERLRLEGLERERRLLRALRRLQTADPELGALQGSETVPLEKLQASLAEGTLLVEYFIARGIVYGCVLGPDRLQIRPLCELSEVAAEHRNLRHQIGRFRLGKEHVERLGEFPTQATLTILGRLHERLIAPLRDLLDCRELVVAPHGLLHELPFHALGDGDRCLTDEFRVSYAPSTTVFHHCVTRAGEPGQGALVLGVPDKRAPRIADEARAVAELLGGAPLLLGDEASPENLARHGEGCRLLHIATHGLFRRDNPMFSAIRLGGARLSLLDLYNLRLAADLVVLSGCSTGLSAARGADELVGLTRGLLYAGARAVIVSLWDVDDDSTCRFMTRFYRHLRAAPPVAALARAQRELRRESPHPYYWAPFLLVGRPAES